MPSQINHVSVMTKSCSPTSQQLFAADSIIRIKLLESCCCVSVTGCVALGEQRLFSVRLCRGASSTHSPAMMRLCDLRVGRCFVSVLFGPRYVVVYCSFVSANGRMGREGA
jgi:hypothetical protein